MKKVALVLVGGIALAGCGAPADTAPATAPEPAAHRGIPIAGTEAEVALLLRLSKIDPGFLSDQDRTIRRATNACHSFARYEGDEQKITDYVLQEFDGGTMAVDTEKAKSILAAVRASGLCG